jgi:hypothetical protein
MHFPYSSLIVEADHAKQQLTRVFQTEAGGSWQIVPSVLRELLQDKDAEDAASINVNSC